MLRMLALGMIGFCSGAVQKNFPTKSLAPDFVMFPSLSPSKFQRNRVAKLQKSKFCHYNDQPIEFEIQKKKKTNPTSSKRRMKRKRKKKRKKTTRRNMKKKKVVIRE